MLELCLLGCGGMMPLPHRRLTSLMARYNGKSILIDCGEGTQVGIKEKGWSFKPIDVICFTHYHADHISGLPGLLLTMGNAYRKDPLTMIGPKGLERVVNAMRVIAPELPFPIEYRELREPEEKLEINGYHITAYRVNHNVTCYGYAIEIPRAGKFDVERAKELGAGALCIEGSPDFYSRSGFAAAGARGIRCGEEPETAPYFLLKELRPGFLDGVTGVYHTPQGYYVDEAAADAFDRNFPPKEKLKLPGQLF